MIVDLRIYTCKANHLADFVALYKEHAWPLQQKYLVNCLGWYTVAEGPLNQVVHMWAYENQGERERRREAMAADPAWKDYMRRAKESGLLVSMENRFLKPTDFCPPITLR